MKYSIYSYIESKPRLKRTENGWICTGFGGDGKGATMEGAWWNFINNQCRVIQSTNQMRLKSDYTKSNFGLLTTDLLGNVYFIKLEDQL